MNIDKSKEYEGLHNISSTEYFHLNCVGKDDHTGTAFPLLRTKGRKDYHILYIVKGSAVAVKNNKEFHLMPDNFLYPDKCVLPCLEQQKCRLRSIPP